MLQLSSDRQSSSNQTAVLATPFVLQDLNDLFAGAQDAFDAESVDLCEEGDDMGGDEGCISAWVNVIPDLPVTGDAQASTDSPGKQNLGTFEDAIALFDCTEVPSVNMPNNPEESTLNEMRARREKLHIMLARRRDRY